MVRDTTLHHLSLLVYEMGVRIFTLYSSVTDPNLDSSDQYLVDTTGKYVNKALCPLHVNEVNFEIFRLPFELLDLIFFHFTCSDYLCTYS